MSDFVHIEYSFINDQLSILLVTCAFDACRKEREAIGWRAFPVIYGLRAAQDMEFGVSYHSQ